MTAATPSPVAWEARAGRFAAAAAALAALLYLAGSVYLAIALEEQPRRTDLVLRAVDREPADFVVAGALTAVASLLFGAVLAYLYRATRSRREQLPIAALALLVFGALAAAVVAIARRVDLIDAAREFLTTGPQTKPRADNVLRDRTSLQVIGGLGLAANLALAFATLLICVNAMRAGLMSRFIGVLGIVIGVLLPLVGAMPVLLFFWLFALAALFLDRWPGGRGPAWAAGEAVPWPTMAERNAEIDRHRAEAEVDGEEGASAGTEPELESPATGEAAEADGAGSEPGSASRSKRKRGRRR
jgi:hypothetical protein